MVAMRKKRILFILVLSGLNGFCCESDGGRSFRNALGGADGSCGTDEAAEVAAYAFGSDDPWTPGGGVEGDSLVAAIGTGGVAPAASYAPLAVDLGINNGLPV